MTLLGPIDPLDFASIKPASTAMSEMATQQAQQQAQQIQAQVAQIKLTEAQTEQAQNNAFRAQLEAMSKAPSVEGYTQLLAIAPKDYVEGLKASISKMDSTAKGVLANQIVGPWLAGVNGNPALMKKELRDLALGYESKGMMDKAAGIRDFLAMAEENPNAVTGKLGHTLLEAMGPEKFNALKDAQGLDAKRRKDEADAILAASNVTPEMLAAKKDEAIAKAKKEGNLAKVAEIEAAYEKRQQEQKLKGGAAQEKADLSRAALTDQQKKQDEELFPGKKEQQEATLADTRSAITKRGMDAAREEQAAQRAAEESKERLKLLGVQIKKGEQELGDLPEGVQKQSTEYMAAAREARLKAGKVRALEMEYSKIPTTGMASAGALRRASESWREFWGNENKRSALDKALAGVLNEELVSIAQKVRPVSDSDMIILRKGMPDVSANPKTAVAPFLKTLADALEKQAQVAADQMAWTNANRGSGNAREDGSINGTKVVKGTSLLDFLERRGHVQEALKIARDPATSPGERAKILAQLKADGENVDGR